MIGATTGSCLCGAVHYTVSALLEDVHACHCTQCRKQSGHFVAAGSAKRSALNVKGAEAITWFASSPGARRGFCKACGSHLFWEQEGSDSVSINIGALDGETGLTLTHHIFCADKGDYYEITDGLPQHAGYPQGPKT